MKKKIQKIYHDHGFGFPVTLLNVPMIQMRGEWVPNINQKELQSIVVEFLALKHRRLSGDEIRFIRLFALKMLEPKPQKFIIAYEQLTEVAPMKSEVVKIDMEKIPA